MSRPMYHLRIVPAPVSALGPRVSLRNAATHVREIVIPDAGHWLMEEQPAATIAAIRTFLDTKN
jgi:pimeloyl-ACP methyl ester carboxylesterase